MLCLDDLTYNILSRLALSHMRLVSLGELEQDDRALAAAKTNRSLIEYYWTCTPVLPRYVLNHAPDSQVVVYLDADLYFYDEPQIVVDEMGDGSVAIVAHRYGPGFAKRLKRGIYNVSLVAFRRDVNALECLQWWRQRCIEWCYDRVEAGRFADQKYLDDWPTRFRHVVVLQHKGVGLAPWNWMNYEIRLDGHRATVDGQALVFYHFHGLKILNRWLYDSGLSGSKPMPPLLLKWFYGGYVRAIYRGWQQVRRVAPRVAWADRSLRPRLYNIRVFAQALRQRQIGLMLPLTS